LVRITFTRCSPSKWPNVGTLPAQLFGERPRASINRASLHKRKRGEEKRREEKRREKEGKEKGKEILPFMLEIECPGSKHP